MNYGKLFRDQTGSPLREGPDLWSPVVIPKEAIEAEIARLADLPPPANGRRESVIVHPQATAPGWGLAPGIRVTLSVLKPGESTRALRHNATEVNFVIAGTGEADIAGKRFGTELYDVWNTPSYHTYHHRNRGTQIYARLIYSNAALLDMLNIYVAEENPPAAQATYADDLARGRDDPRARSPYGTFPLGDDGAWLMPYEALINPPAIAAKALHFPWAQVKREVDKLEALGQDYIGRRLYLLYDPTTGRTNGITPNFFATMTIRPPRIVDRPHRHVSAAINYFFSGRGRSTVEGVTYEWKAGDLMLSAPGWAVHNHASFDEPVYELTVQDQPLNIWMQSLLWQEDLKLPPRILGAETGFGTNRRRAAAE
jgi:gentisate 1,2-dioxygenase